MRGTLEPQAEPRRDVFDGLVTCMKPGGRKSVKQYHGNSLWKNREKNSMPFHGR